MKIRPFALAAIAAAMLALTGCASPASSGSNSTIETTSTELRPRYNPDSLKPPYYNFVYYQTLPDGYELMCIYGADDNRAGGPSCNWEAYNKHLESKELAQ